MSEDVQRRAAKRRASALQRARNARERAELSRRRGDDLVARLHEQSARRHELAAAAAERLRLDDVAIEGDLLADARDSRAPRP